MKKIYITATRQNDGKTLLTLGLTSYLAKKVGKIGFIKPLGLRDLKSGTYRIDQDTLLIDKACRVHCNIQDMNPIAITWEFTKEYLRQEKRSALIEEVKAAFGRVSQDKDLVVIEGTGHAGMGSILQLSNARVAAELGAKVLLVSSGGIGHPIEEVYLNKALFDKFNVEVLGVVMNKVFPHERELMLSMGKEILDNLGIPLLGAIPYERLLAKPTVMQVLEACRGELIAGDTALTRRVDRVLLGAMGISSALERFETCEGDILIVTPGDRADLIIPLAGQFGTPSAKSPRLAGFVLTGGIRPSPSVHRFLKPLEIPVILVREDSYTAANTIHDLAVKIAPNDWEKIELINSMISQHVDCDRILEML